MPSSMLQLLLVVSGVVVMAAVVSASDIEHRQLAATVPEAPKGLKAEEVTNGVYKGLVSVSWTPNGGDVTGYDIADRWGLLMENVRNPYYFGGMAACSEQFVRVRAKNSAGKSEWSAPLTGVWVTMPVPEGFSARPESATTISVQWSSMYRIPDVISYDLEIDGLIVSVPREVSRRDHSPPVDGKVHTYRVRSRGLRGCVSQWSITVSAKLPSPKIPKSGWTVVSSSSSQGGHPAAHAIDGNPSTFWHTRWTPTPIAASPHELVIDLGAVYAVDAFSYLPRQDKSWNGNIGSYEFYVSSSRTDFGGVVSSGKFSDSKAEQTGLFRQPLPKAGRYIKLVAMDEAGRRGPWASVAEINIHGIRL